MAAAEPNLEAAVDIDAPAADVWTVVSDVRRMGEWSPECRKVVVWGGKPLRVGSWLTGINRRKLVVWWTTSRIHVFRDGEAIGWRTLESGARWVFEIEETASGTRLTERREMPQGMPMRARGFASALLGGVDEHTDELQAGIQTTLEQIKREVEAGR